MILGCPNCGARFRVDADAVGSAGRRVRCSRCRHQWEATAAELLPEPVAAPAAAAAPRAARGLNVLRPKPKPQPLAKPQSATRAAPPPKPKPAPVAAPPPPPPPPPPEPEPVPEPAPALALDDSADDARAQAEAGMEEPPPPLPEAPAEPSRGKAAPRKRSAFGRIAAVIGWLLFVLAVGGLAGAAIESERVMEEMPETKAVFAALGFHVPAPGEGLKLTNVTSTRVTVDGAPSLVVEGRVTNTAEGRRDVPKLRGSLRDATDRELHAWQFTASQDKLSAGEVATFRTEVISPNPQATGLSITFVTPQ